MSEETGWRRGMPGENTADDGEVAKDEEARGAGYKRSDFIRKCFLDQLPAINLQI